MRNPFRFAAIALACFVSTPALAQDKDYDKEMAELDAEIAADEAAAKAKSLSAAELLDAAPAEDWLSIPVSDLLIFTLPNAADGTKRQAVIQLLPAQYSGGHVRNVRKLAKARWWDGTKIYRVAKNFVTQFGGNPLAKKLPRNLEIVPESEYFNAAIGAKRDADMAALKTAVEAGNQNRDTKIRPLMKIIYENRGAEVGFGGGWPVAKKNGGSYAVMCRGSLSPAHYDPPDTGSGAELSVITGEEARGLDATFGIVGRVIDGLEHLINLPPGDAPGGFYASKSKHIPIQSIRLAEELPAAQQPRYEYLASSSPFLLQYIDAHGGYGNICTVDYPVRKIVE